VNHVVFVQQENRSFDSYFGMLNPYRRARGWNIGDDQRQYDVDGIDDKLSTIFNKNDEGQVFPLFHTTSSCLDDMSSAWLESNVALSVKPVLSKVNPGVPGIVLIFAGSAELLLLPSRFNPT